MKEHRPYCRWCGGRGCLACPPVQLIATNSVEQAVQQLLTDDGVIVIQVRNDIMVHRMPPVHPDRELCDQDPDLEALFDERTPVERGVAVIGFDREFFTWQMQFEKPKRRRLRVSRSAKSQPRSAR